MSQAEAPAGRLRPRLWDVPTRLVHWALVVLLGFSWWSAETGRLEQHRWSGYTVLALLVFRILWGLWGSASARFTNFVRGPAATAAYLRTMPSRTHVVSPGHNPLGAWSVLAILTVLAIQVTTGLFAVDVDGLESGPLSERVSFDLGRRFAGWHEISFAVLQALVALHIAAVAFHLVYKRYDLLSPMITGRARFAVDPGLRFAPLWRALLTAILALLAAWWVSRGFRV
jgi:cytochrome b